VELLLFLAFFAVVGGSVVSILFATNDQRVRQQTIASVERMGLQILQGLKWRIEHAERILDPPLGASGSILSLQMASESDHPMIVGRENGALVLVLRESKKILTTEGVTLSNFAVRNTSASATRLTVFLSFDLTETYPLPVSPLRDYTRRFEMLVPLFPRDHPTGNSCGCAPPSCQGGNYIWEICSGQTCSVATVTLPCS
jgi:hypothetical protein